MTVPEHASGGYLVASSLQQTSPEGSSFVPLVDVGTATLRLSNAFTQTDVDIDHHQNQHHPCFPPPQLSPPKADLTNMYRPRGHQQNHRRRECCIGTPPANSGLMSAVSIGNSSPPNCKFVTSLLILFARFCLFDATTTVNLFTTLGFDPNNALQRPRGSKFSTVYCSPNSFSRTDITLAISWNHILSLLANKLQIRFESDYFVASLSHV